MAFKDGIDLNTSNAARYTVATVLLLVYQKACTNNMRLLPRERNISFALGIPVFMMGAGYLGATQYIPVSLAVLVFYTGPCFVAVISRFTESEPLTINRMIAIVLAFIGLALALKIRTTPDLHLLGIFYALIGAIGFASFITVSSLMLRSADRRAILLHSLAAGTCLFVLFFVFTNPAEMNGTDAGWLKVIGSGIFIAVAYMTFFSGMQIVGPVKTSMTMNIEPIFTIAIATLLLGEHLAVIQLFGAALVLGGIALIAYTPSRR